MTSLQSAADVFSWSTADTTLEGTRIVAAGKVQVLAGQNLDIRAAGNTTFVEDKARSWSLFDNNIGYTLNHKVKDETSTSSTTLTGAYLAGDSVALVAGGNAHLVATTFIFKMRDGASLERQTGTVVPGSIDAGGQLNLTAGTAVELGAVDIHSGGATVFTAPSVSFIAERNSDYLSHRVWDNDRMYEVNKGDGHEGFRQFTRTDVADDRFEAQHFFAHPFRLRRPREGSCGSSLVLLGESGFSSPFGVVMLP